VGIQLGEASLADVARELHRRARKTCSHCGGYGHVCPPEHTSSAMANASTCARCGGTGYEPWPELYALAAQLERLGKER